MLTEKTAKIGLLCELLALQIEAGIPVRTEEYPVEFEPRIFVELPKLPAPRQKAWQNPYENIGRR